MKDAPKQLNLPGVPRAKQGREVAPGWAWTQAQVWTERMLATLERGIEGGKWYSLIDKVWKEATLREAAEAVIRNAGAAGVDGQTTELLEAQVEETITTLNRQLREERYAPQPVKRQWIPKLGSAEKRPLGIPTVRDRVVQTALVYVLEPIWERDFAQHSYGFRPGRNAQQAIERVETLLQQGHVWIVDADLKGYFDTIHPAGKTAGSGRGQSGRQPGAETHRKVSAAGRDGNGQGMDADPTRHPAGRRTESALSQCLPGPLGPQNGRGETGDDALRG